MGDGFEVMPGFGACVVPGCSRKARRGQLTCGPCWARVTPETKALVNAAFRRWRRGQGTLGDLRAAQLQAVMEAEA
jgi:ribosomal protein L39E